MPLYKIIDYGDISVSDFYITTACNEEEALDRIYTKNNIFYKQYKQTLETFDSFNTEILECAKTKSEKKELYMVIKKELENKLLKKIHELFDSLEAFDKLWAEIDE